MNLGAKVRKVSPEHCHRMKKTAKMSWRREREEKVVSRRGRGQLFKEVGLSPKRSSELCGRLAASFEDNLAG